MLTLIRTLKPASLIAATVACVLIISTDPVWFFRPTSASPDDKNTTAPPAKNEGSADKKDEPARALAKFMRQKLHASNLILEGLCTEDLQMVSEGSQTLMKMSSEERWRVSNDVMYRRYSNEFVQAVEELQKEAEDNDMDGTSMAWVNVTMKCLKCHEWVRNTVLV
ncbi:MAG: cytochrome c, partial [Planctomycetaceae bacterium]|nr:cytochrome c [Planctomycetaceae bacterium]